MESEKMLVRARICLVILIGLTGPYSATVGHAERDVIHVTTPSGHNGDKGKVRDTAHLPETVAEQPAGPLAHSTHASEDVPCHDNQLSNHHGIDDFLSALNGDLGSAERFGICSQHDAVPDLQVTQLTENVRQQQNGLKGVQATEVDIWEAEKEQEIILALKFPRFIQPTSPASLMLLFNVGSMETDDLKIKFNSPFLHPNTQTVCISASTRFLLLPGGQRESHTHAHLKLRIKVETLKAENGKKLSLSELEEILMRKVNGSSIAIKPMLLFLADKTLGESVPHFKSSGIPLDKRPSSPHPPSKTYPFLCELQKFLSDVFPQKEPSESHKQESTPFYTLHSLPPLTLGESSPHSLLSSLVNSSTQTVFVFPPHQQGLQTHHVGLNLDTSLLSVLRLKLGEAIAQVKKEEAGQMMIDRLQRLIEMCAIPSEGMNDEAVTTEHKEAQYRSVLLLKALQTVLSIWEVERAQRAARADEDGQMMPQQCRLQSLTVSLRKYSLEPSVAKINNCEGSCSFPISTITNNHVVLLSSHIEEGHTVDRTPCCVPVEYTDLFLIELESKGTSASFKTNVVATRCECR